MNKGQVVISKNGRDKGKYFIILDIEDEYLFLADGNLRTITKPKKKKIKHTQKTNKIFDLESVGARGLQDADLKKWIREAEEIFLLRSASQKPSQIEASATN